MSTRFTLLAPPHSTAWPAGKPDASLVIAHDDEDPAIARLDLAKPKVEGSPLGVRPVLAEFTGVNEHLRWRQSEICVPPVCVRDVHDAHARRATCAESFMLWRGRISCSGMHSVDAVDGFRRRPSLTSGARITCKHFGW
eukprot:scaffold549_cov72-Phaeocystis_antarctica.AAC.2